MFGHRKLLAPNALMSRCLCDLQVRLSILVVPLAVAVLIFGVSAAQSGTVPFLTPFLILCALGLASVAAVFSFAV